MPDAGHFHLTGDNPHVYCRPPDEEGPGVEQTAPGGRGGRIRLPRRRPEREPVWRDMVDAGGGHDPESTWRRAGCRSWWRGGTGRVRRPARPRHSVRAVLDQPGVPAGGRLQLARHSDPKLTMRCTGGCGYMTRHRGRAAAGADARNVAVPGPPPAATGQDADMYAAVPEHVPAGDSVRGELEAELRENTQPLIHAPDSREKRTGGLEGSLEEAREKDSNLRPPVNSGRRVADTREGPRTQGLFGPGGLQVHTRLQYRADSVRDGFPGTTGTPRRRLRPLRRTACAPSDSVTGAAR